MRSSTKGSAGSFAGFLRGYFCFLFCFFTSQDSVSCGIHGLGEAQRGFFFFGVPQVGSKALRNTGLEKDGTFVIRALSTSKLHLQHTEHQHWHHFHTTTTKRNLQQLPTPQIWSSSSPQKFWESSNTLSSSPPWIKKAKLQNSPKFSL